MADLAGVSRTTVSFVLNEDHRFSIRPETRERVLQAAKTLNYTPNASARALALRKSRAIGLILTHDPRNMASDSLIPQILGGLLDSAKQFGLGLMVEWVEPGQEIQVYQTLTKARKIDGLILLTPRCDDSGLKELEESDIPTVLLGQVTGSKLYSVDIDNFTSTIAAVNHLIELGHRRIACLVNTPGSYSFAADQLRGYNASLTLAGIEYDEKLVRFTHFDPQSGYEQMQSLLQSEEPFTAAFVYSDHVALGAMKAIREAGLTIPGDISLVGFEDLPLAEFTNPKLTTMHVPASQLARLSCHLLVRLMKGELPESRGMSLETQLILRDSTRAIPS